MTSYYKRVILYSL